jgi:hypothetical protein
LSEGPVMARCRTRGAELDDPRQPFCGGDRCARVFLNASGWRERTPPVGSIGYTGSYREPCADIVEVSVVSVLEARGPD